MFKQTLVDEFLFDYQVRELSELTVSNYRKQLSHFVKFLSSQCEVDSFEQLKPIHIKQFMNYYCLRQCKPSYINDMLKAVKVLCGYAKRENYTEELVSESVKNVKEPKILIHTFSSDEILKMINFYNRKDYISIRNQMILMILFDTGIRVNELIIMKPDQIQDSYLWKRKKRKGCSEKSDGGEENV